MPKCCECKSFEVLDITDFQDDVNIFFCPTCERVLDGRDDLYLKVDLLEEKYPCLDIIVTDIVGTSEFMIQVEFDNLDESLNEDIIRHMIADINLELKDYLEG